MNKRKREGVDATPPRPAPAARPARTDLIDDHVLLKLVGYLGLREAWYMRCVSRRWRTMIEKAAREGALGSVLDVGAKRPGAPELGTAALLLQRGAIRLPAEGSLRVTLAPECGPSVVRLRAFLQIACGALAGALREVRVDLGSPQAPLADCEDVCGLLRAGLFSEPPDLAAALEPLRALTELRLPRGLLRAAPVVARSLPRLEVLELWTPLDGVQGAPMLPRVRALRVRGRAPLERGELAWLARLPALEELELTARGAEQLAALADLLPALRPSASSSADGPADDAPLRRACEAARAAGLRVRATLAAELFVVVLSPAQQRAALDAFKAHAGHLRGRFATQEPAQLPFKLRLCAAQLSQQLAPFSELRAAGRVRATLRLGAAEQLRAAERTAGMERGALGGAFAADLSALRAAACAALRRLVPRADASCAE
eukprot:tig00000350_g24336.t1